MRNLYTFRQPRWLPPFAWAAAICLLLSTLATQARAEFPKLPDSAITDDTVTLVFVNFSRLTPELWRNAANALLGPQVALADEPLADWQNLYTGPREAGLDYFVISMPSSTQHPDPVFYVHLRPGADAAAVDKAIDKAIRGETASGTRDNDVVYTQSGDFLIYRAKDQPPPAGGSAVRAKQFTEAFAELFTNGDKPLACVFIPNEYCRDEIKKSFNGLNAQLPPGAAEVLSASVDGKSLSLSLAVGDAPALAVVVKMADLPAATALVQKVNACLDQFKKLADSVGKSDAPGAAKRAEALDAFASGFRPAHA